MASLPGYRERLYYELWACDFNVTGDAGCTADRALFLGNNLNPSLTNMKAIGALPSDQTAAVLAIGYEFLAYVCHDGLTADVVRPAATPASMTPTDLQFIVEMWHLFRKQNVLSFVVDSKPVWIAHVDHAPAAGGTDGAVALSTGGFTSGVDAGVDVAQGWINNGVPSAEALKRFAKPIVFDPRQQFEVDVRTGPALQNGGAPTALTIAVPSVLAYLNAGNPAAPANTFDYKAGFCTLYVVLTRNVN